MLEKRIIYDLTPFSLLDYPDKASCIIWFAGCNMRCSYCYNPDIVLGKGQITIRQVLSFIRKRQHLLDGVVFSGGECTLHKEIVPLAAQIKQLGMLVKVDTNGSSPTRLKALIDQALVDFVSLDLKAPHNKFNAITQSNLYDKFLESLHLLQQSNIPFEVRTTTHSDLLSQQDLEDLTRLLVKQGYRGKYAIQNFLDDSSTLGKIENRHHRIKELKSPDESILIEIRN